MPSALLPRDSVIEEDTETTGMASEVKASAPETMVTAVETTAMDLERLSQPMIIGEMESRLEEITAVPKMRGARPVEAVKMLGSVALLSCV